MDNRTLGQTITKAKQELKTVQPQIANDKLSPLPGNCNHDQLLFSIVHEQVDVNRRILLSTANEASRYCDSNPQHTITVPPTAHDSRPTSPCFKLQADDNSTLTYGQIPARPRRPHLDNSRQLLPGFPPTKLRPV